MRKLENTEVSELQDGEHPPLQPKRLGRIGSYFFWKPLWMRRFSKFVLEAEILSEFQAIFGKFWCPGRA